MDLDKNYGEFFTAFKDVVSNFVRMVKLFTETIKKFVDGFKKEITVDEFEDHQA